MKVTTRTLGLTLALISSSLIATLPAYARPEVTATTAPPPPRVEAIPSVRAGSVWAPGHWEWNGRFYSWASGTWIVDRHGSHWVADQWQQAGDRWHYTDGHWEH
jgi:hypothetical protein